MDYNELILSEARHVRDSEGVCWKHIAVTGDAAWIICGRASYEAVIRCDEHSPLGAPRKRKQSKGKER